MEIKKRVFFIAFLITIFLLFSLILINDILGDKREEYINSEIQTMYNNFNEMQTFILMSEIYGDKMACLAFKNKLEDLDQSIWELGKKIDQYRIASEQFFNDPYYFQQKKIFNENEIFYMSLLKKLKKQCDIDTVIISFFYRNKKDCNKCDDQAFVLTDLNKDIDEEIFIFSFDADLKISFIDLLIEYHKIEEFPCVIIEENKFCGMMDKNEIKNKICSISPNVSICN